MVSNPLSPDIIEKALQVGDPDGISPLEARVTERLMLISVANMRCSLTVADPSLYDCPLIGCSDGFESLTGYSRAEVVGRNCRFLNDKQELDPDIRQALRSACSTGIEFIGILPNRRKNGERFRNLLHMTSISLRDHRYIIGIQADVTHANFDLTNVHHLEDLRVATERIFSANVDAWVQMQAHEFEVRLPVPYAEIVKNYAPEQYKEAQGKFIQIAGQIVQHKNSFLHVMDSSGEHDEFKLKKSASNPLFLERASGSPAEEAQSSDPAEDFVKASQSDSCDRDVSAENSGSRGSSSDEACQNYPEELKSVGSAGHPHRCRECSFYFFAAQGCIKGSDCRFCHEFHPRKNWRKNRRILKRLEVGDTSIPEERSAEGEGHCILKRHEVGDSVSIPRIRPGEVAADPASASLGRSSAHGSSSTSTAPGSSKAVCNSSSIEAVISLRYLRHGPEKKQAKLTLAVGQEVNLPAWVEMDRWQFFIDLALQRA